MDCHAFRPLTLIAALTLCGAVEIGAQSTSGNSNPREFTAPVLPYATTYFIAAPNATTVNLYRTNGAIGAATLLKAFPFGSGLHGPSQLTAMPVTNVYFAADDGTGQGEELWLTDGVTTALSADVSPGASSSNPRDLTPLGATRIVFSATTAAHGRELWTTDGFTLLRLTDANPGPAHSDPRHVTAIGPTVYFTAFDPLAGRELWKTNGTVAGTGRVANIAPGPSSSIPHALAALGNELLFSATNDTNGFELWTSDGTPAGTVMVRDIRPGIESSAPAHFVALSHDAYFTADDGVTGAELWRSNATGPGTQRVADVRPGAEGSNPRWITPSFFNYGVWFAADDGVSGFELWRSNGLANGTHLFADIAPGMDSSWPTRLVRLGSDEVLFTADDGVTGRELWHASVLGGASLIELKPGPCGSRVTGLFDPGSLGVPLFSAESDDGAGLELWTTNGSLSGTTRLENLNQSPDQPNLDIDHRLNNSQSIINTTFKASGFAPNAPAAMWFAPSPIAGIDLGPLGLLGSLSVGPVIATAPLTTDIGGNASVTLPFASSGGGIGEIVAQAIGFLPPGANPLGIEVTNNSSTCFGELALPCGTLDKVQGHYTDDNFDYCFLVSKPFSGEVWVRLVKTIQNSTDEVFLQLVPIHKGENLIQLVRKLDFGEAIEARFYCGKPDDDRDAPYVACILGC